MEEPREYTSEEIRNMVYDHIWDLIRYWDKLESGKDQRDRLEGLAFSILSMFDGSTLALPAFIIAPCPHPEDKAYHKEQGENWFPENHEMEEKLKGAITDRVMLHELFFHYDKKK